MFSHISDAFESLEHRILWQYDNSSLDTVPPNVLIYTDAPRYDILAHPNVVLYLSNTEYFESIYYAVPILMLPFTGAQTLKAKRIETIGCGLELTGLLLTVDDLNASIRKMLYTKNFTKKAIEMSAILKKNIVHPMDRAMYWIEYVIRHKGAKHLQSYAVHMPFYQFLQWDLFGPIILFLVTGISSLMISMFYYYLVPPNVWLN